MTEQEYLEYIKQENENHRETLRQDYLQYTENVKQALIDLQNSSLEQTLRANFISAALNGMLASGDWADFTIDMICDVAIEHADTLLEKMCKSA